MNVATFRLHLPSMIKMPESEESEDKDTAALSERTPIRLGAIAGLVGFFCITVVGAAVFITSSLTELKTQVGTIVSTLQNATIANQNLANEQKQHERADNLMWAELKGRIQAIEQNGSQATRELAKDLIQLRKDFEIYRATQTKGAL